MEGKIEFAIFCIENVAKELLPTLKSGNVVIGLGAGTITDLGKYLQKYYGAKSKYSSGLRGTPLYQSSK